MSSEPTWLVTTATALDRATADAYGERLADALAAAVARPLDVQLITGAGAR